MSLCQPPKAKEGQYCPLNEGSRQQGFSRTEIVQYLPTINQTEHAQIQAQSAETSHF